MDSKNAPLREFLEIPYDRLEELNLESKAHQESWTPMEKIEKERRAYLESEKRIKAVTVAFTDLEGRLHMLDYDKKFLLGADGAVTHVRVRPSGTFAGRDATGPSSFSLLYRIMVRY